jgi:hypothetical protein
MNKLLPILLAASLGFAHSLAAQAKPDSVATGKTKLGVTLKGAKLGRDWSRR